MCLCIHMTAYTTLSIHIHSGISVSKGEGQREREEVEGKRGKAYLKCFNVVVKEGLSEEMTFSRRPTGIMFWAEQLACTKALRWVSRE